MFPRTAFPPVIFPPPVFPEPAGGRPPPAPGPWLGWLPLMGGGRSVPSVATNFAQAIEASWAANGLTSTVGDLVQMRLAPGTAPPTSTFTIERGAPRLLTSTSSVYEYRVAFRIRDASAANAHTRAALVAGVFDKADISWTTGIAMKAIQERWSPRVEPKPSVGGAATVFCEDLEYCWRVRGPR